MSKISLATLVFPAFLMTAGPASAQSPDQRCLASGKLLVAKTVEGNYRMQLPTRTDASKQRNSEFEPSTSKGLSVYRITLTEPVDYVAVGTKGFGISCKVTFKTDITRKGFTQEFNPPPLSEDLLDKMDGIFDAIFPPDLDRKNFDFDRFRLEFKQDLNFDQWLNYKNIDEQKQDNIDIMFDLLGEPGNEHISSTVWDTVISRGRNLILRTDEESIRKEKDAFLDQIRQAELARLAEDTKNGFDRRAVREAKKKTLKAKRQAEIEASAAAAHRELDERRRAADEESRNQEEQAKKTADEQRARVEQFNQKRLIEIKRLQAEQDEKLKYEEQQRQLVGEIVADQIKRCVPPKLSRVVNEELVFTLEIHINGELTDRPSYKGTPIQQEVARQIATYIESRCSHFQIPEGFRKSHEIWKRMDVAVKFNSDSRTEDTAAPLNTPAKPTAPSVSASATPQTLVTRPARPQTTMTPSGRTITKADGQSVTLDQQKVLPQAPARSQNRLSSFRQFSDTRSQPTVGQLSESRGPSARRSYERPEIAMRRQIRRFADRNEQEAQLKTPLQSCCDRAAWQNGHTGTKGACYASVCTHYVTMQPDGRRCRASGAVFKAYRQELWQRCGIVR